ncbi:MAG: PHB depolymerase family esterase [Tardiphaga sp.]
MFSFTDWFGFFPSSQPPSRINLRETERFGTNPGGLRMFTYVPEKLAAGAPLVVVLHGALQSAGDYAHGSGWLTLAERFGFAVLFPEQSRTNNAFRCFHWYRRRDTERGQGEGRSIWQMIERTTAHHQIDRRSVFITGLSAGGAMTNAMLAAYPEVFAAGAVIAGLPFGAASNLQEALNCMAPGFARAGSDWGDRVRAASSNTGSWPRISVWHGDADDTVHALNADETVKQWINVHGLTDDPTVTEHLDGCVREAWHDRSGGPQIERYAIPHMLHGTPVGPDSGGAPCGQRGAYFLDVGLSSSWLIAQFWGLVDECTSTSRVSGVMLERAR